MLIRNIANQFSPSIGRLLTAIVQYPRDELLIVHIEEIINIYMKAVENVFKNSPDHKLANYSKNNWKDFQKQILLFALDWALYWKRDGNRNKFEKDHFDEFVRVVKNLLNCSDIEKESIDTAHDPPSPSESVDEYPEAGVEEAKELFDKAFEMWLLDRKIDDAYDTCHEAYTIVESSGNSTEKAFVSLWLGFMASWTEKSISVALDWLKNTVLIFQEQPDQVVVELSPRDENILLECYCHLVWVYWFMGEEYYDNAEDALRRWYALYWGEEDYSNTLTIEQILEQPIDVKKKDIEFHFDWIWQNAAKLYFSKQEFATAAAIYEALAKQETDEKIADINIVLTGMKGRTLEAWTDDNYYLPLGSACEKDQIHIDISIPVHTSIKTLSVLLYNHIKELFSNFPGARLDNKLINDIIHQIRGRS